MYFITVFESIENYPGFKGCQRTWGYYPTFEQAYATVRYNITDLHEGCYDYALIERIDSGISAHAEQLRWFQWNKDEKTYIEIARPDSAKRICNFAIG